MQYKMCVPICASTRVASSNIEMKSKSVVPMEKRVTKY